MKKISKILSIILCLTLVLSMVVFASAAGESATISFADEANRTSQDTESQVWEANGIKVTNNKGGATSNVAAYTNPVRFYKGTDVIIESANMTGIVINCPTEGYANVWVETNADSNATVTVSGTVVTVTFASATNSYSLSSLSAQTRVNELTVYYGGSAPVIPEEPDVPETPSTPSIVPISTALAGKDGDSFMVKGVVTLIDGKNIYLQDATGGICVRASVNVEDVVVGDTVIGTGTRSVYNGLVQLGGSYEKSSGGKLTVKETTIAALTTADIGTYIKLSSVTITEIFDNNGAYTTPNVTVTDGTNEIQIYKAACGKNPDGTWAFAVGDVIDVYAAVGCYNSTLQLRNTVTAEIVAAGAEGPDFIPAPGEPVGPGEPNQGTGDLSIAGLVVALTAAAGCTVVLTKKKEF